MLNSRSPFYIQPRLSWSLIDWGLKFMRSATAEKVAAAAEPLRDIALMSQQCYLSWQQLPGIEMAYEHKGLLEYFQTENLKRTRIIPLRRRRHWDWMQLYSSARPCRRWNRKRGLPSGVLYISNVMPICIPIK